MKRHRDSDELAKRFLEAASKPPGITPRPTSPPAPAVKAETVVPEERPKQETTKVPEAPEPPEQHETPTKAEEQLRPAKRSVKREARKKPANDDAVPISLRPPRAILQRYVMAAANRTQAVGRVVSVQEMILEAMERGP
jgi:hypothetical protein